MCRGIVKRRHSRIICRKYGVDFIKHFLDDEEGITKRQQNEFITDLLKIGYDINYRKFLHKYNTDLDEFAILIDRDIQTHSELNMQECIRHCLDNNYSCYIVLSFGYFFVFRMLRMSTLINY